MSISSESSLPLNHPHCDILGAKLRARQGDTPGSKLRARRGDKLRAKLREASGDTVGLN